MAISRRSRSAADALREAADRLSAAADLIEEMEAEDATPAEQKSLAEDALASVEDAGDEAARAVDEAAQAARERLDSFEATPGKRYIFWDTEATGLNTRFDQVLQIAAIVTDETFREIDRIDLRSRRLPEVVPMPGAVLVTRVDPDKVETGMSHFEMITKFREWAERHGPAQFISYNGFNYDEDILRQAFYKSLQDPFLTNTNGNSRLDALRLAQGAWIYAPEAVKSETKANGRQNFKLGKFAEHNGIKLSEHELHDALADVKVMVKAVEMIRTRAPEVWDHLQRMSDPKSVQEFVRGTPVLSFQDMAFGSRYGHMATLGAVNPDNPKEMLLWDLSKDPAKYADSTPEQLARLFESGRGRVGRRIYANDMPMLGTPEMAAAAKLYDPATLPDLQARARAVQEPAFQAKLQAALKLMTPSGGEHTLLEDRIYERFPNPGDRDLMREFAGMETWKQRARLQGAFFDDRYNQVLERVLYDNAPELLPAETKQRLDQWVADRLARPHFDDRGRDVPWGTIHKARDEIRQIEWEVEHKKRHLTPDDKQRLERWSKTYDALEARAEQLAGDAPKHAPPPAATETAEPPAGRRNGRKKPGAAPAPLKELEATVAQARAEPAPAAEAARKPGRRRGAASTPA